MKGIKNKIGEEVCSLALDTAKKSIDSMCLILLHQPKVPAKLKEKYQK